MTNHERDDPTGDPDYEAGVRLAQMQEALRARRVENAMRRRELVRTEFSLVKRDPKDVTAAIGIGFVLARLGLRAADSWRLDGLLSESVQEFVERLLVAADHVPDATAGIVLVRAIDMASAELAAKGQFAAWRRQAERYVAEHAEWLATEPALRDGGAWRDLPMSAGQQELIRTTCALLEIDLPGHLRRGSAHDWLVQNGANLRYREMGS